MARGVPMVIYRPIPGQEERNCDFVQEAGAAYRVHDLDDMNLRLRQLLESPERLAEMRARALHLGRPRAAYEVARSILGRI
jgi:processive 1,2-diacylglycerol beta-glucosyltransferase